MRKFRCYLFSLLLSLRALVQKLYMTARNALVACPTFNIIALIKDKLWRHIKVRVETIASPLFKTFHIRSNRSSSKRIFYGPRQQAIQRPISTRLAIQRMRGNISTVTLCCISQQVTGISFRFSPLLRACLAMASIRISRLFFGDIQEVSVTPSRHRNIHTGFI